MNTPIYDFLSAYAKNDTVRFHMPGHKGKGSLGIEALDITEIDGADVLSFANGIIGESEENATKLFGSGKTVYTTGGATSAIFAMLSVAKDAYQTKERPSILAARGAHRSFLEGVAFLDIPVHFMLPERAETIYSGVMSAEEVEKAILAQSEPPFAVYITSPTYLGELWEMREIADVCQRHGLPLLVDNAHGAYLAFLSPSLHPIHLGATMCADSAHKTLPVLTGGAYLHAAKGKEHLFPLLKEHLSLFSSTSPSYLTLASLDLANRTLADGYGEKLARVLHRMQEAKRRLQEASFHVMGNEPLKLVLSDAHAEALCDTIRKNGIEPELCDKTHLVLMASAENKLSDFDVLEKALLSKASFAAAPLPPPKPHLGHVAVSVREALFSKKETVATHDALGRIYAEISASCPPAVPIAVCGERIDEDTVGALLYYGIQKVRVIKEPESIHR